MQIYQSLDNNHLANDLINSKIGLLPTDTIYGISSSVFSESAIERIYALKGRSETKPVIVLLADISDLGSFDIGLDKNKKEILSANWPGPFSFILPIGDDFHYLSRDAKGLAFRIPDNNKLRMLLRKTGPLVSTSANPSGQRSANNVAEAAEYFRDELDFYVDLGELDGVASTVVSLTCDTPKILRQGEKELLI